MYKPTAELVDEIMRSNPSWVSGTVTSYPIPVIENGRLLVAVFRYSAGYNTEIHGMDMGSPKQVLLVDPTTGALVREEPRAPVHALGNESFTVPPSEYMQLSAELYGAYDALLLPFVRRQKGPEVAAAANTWKRVFARFEGKLLRPFYEQIGKDWFSWLDEVTNDAGHP